MSQIKVSASLGGRKITLEPIREKVLQIPAREVESTIPCGFQVNWVEGDLDKENFDLNCGAGFGSPWLTFHYKGKSYCFNAEDVVKQFIEFADNE